MFNSIKLDSGLTIITNELKGTEAVTTMIMCGAGSRYETKEMNGLSHFLEHVFFKGAKKYKNTKEVSEAIDSIGGEFNAFTGKEYVGYYVTSPKEQYLRSFDVLSDMLLYPKFEEVEIEKERGVILEEMNMYEDIPMQKIHEVFEEQIFGDSPLGRSILGTKKIVSNIKRNDFIKYKEQQYTPENLVISIAGNIKHEEVVKKAKEYFLFKSDKTAVKPYKFNKFPDSKKIKLYTKKTEQAHLMIGFPTFGADNFHRRMATKTLATVLGGNMSSRMFLSVREAQGLCYYVRTQYSGYMGAGYFSTAAGVDLTRVPQAVQAITQEYKKASTGNITEEELIRAKEYLKGKMTLGLEDSSSISQFYAVQHIVYKDIKHLSEIKKEIDSITLEEVNNLAEEILKEDQLKLSLIGPFDKEGDFEKALKY